MFGGGEEYFAEPEPVDKETLYRFATFCNKLRSAEKAGKKTINDLVETANAVGSSLMCNEMVIGALYRHIKTWKGTKLWVYWCLLDKLCKDYPQSYGYVAGQYILEIGTEYIPWEEETPEKPRYQGLVEHWDGVFPKEVIQVIWKARKERLHNLKHPDEARQQMQDEEETWKREEQRHQEEEGLDDYAEPCLAYLQGVCSWGKGCPQLHPEGLEGTLPPECRMGDWRCSSCGTINRHFRRRCFSCPKEKPQYRKGQQRTDEEKLLSQPDTAAMDVFSQQFGYDPAEVEEARRFWEEKFSGSGAGLTVEQWRLERAAAYCTRILRKEPTNDMEKATADRLNWKSSSDPEWQSHVNEASVGASEDATRPRKKRMMESKSALPTIPPMPARDRFYYCANRVIENGMHHSEAPGYLFLMCQALAAAVKDPGFAQAPTTDATLTVLHCCKLVFTHWTTTGKSRTHPAVPFFSDIKASIQMIPFHASQREEALQYCNLVERA